MRQDFILDELLGRLGDLLLLVGKLFRGKNFTAVNVCNQEFAAFKYCPVHFHFLPPLT